MQDIRCKEFETLLAQYVDGTLEQNTRKGMAGHSLRCRSCRILLDDVKVKLREVGQSEEVITNSRLEAALELIPESESDLSCKSFEDLISDFLDGFVHATVYHKFARHSDACSKCSLVLTDVVYAVAACHSVHIYEEEDVPPNLERKLDAIGSRSVRRRSTEILGLSGWATAGLPAGYLGTLRDRISRLVPATSLERVATVYGLLLASLAIAIFGTGGNPGVSGMFKKAQSRATSIYSQRQVVEARFEKVGEDLGRVWKVLGGTDSMDGREIQEAQSPALEPSRTGGQGR